VDCRAGRVAGIVVGNVRLVDGAAQRDGSVGCGSRSYLRQQLLAQGEELNMLRSAAGTGKNAVNIERAAQQQLLNRIQRLESENTGLKEDILLFERLIPVAGESASVRVENFRVSKESATRYRYRLLIAFQPDKQSPDFRGRLEVAVSFANAGKALQLMLPQKGESPADYQLQIKHFLRREGVFELPVGAILQGVEARVLQGDTLKVQAIGSTLGVAHVWKKERKQASGAY
jgi:hypothetical protein